MQSTVFLVAWFSLASCRPTVISTDIFLNRSLNILWHVSIRQSTVLRLFLFIKSTVQPYWTNLPRYSRLFSRFFNFVSRSSCSQLHLQVTRLSNPSLRNRYNKVDWIIFTVDYPTLILCTLFLVKSAVDCFHPWQTSMKSTVLPASFGLSFFYAPWQNSNLDID